MTDCQRQIIRIFMHSIKGYVGRRVRLATSFGQYNLHGVVTSISVDPAAMTVEFTFRAGSYHWSGEYHLGSTKRWKRLNQPYSVRIDLNHFCFITFQDDVAGWKLENGRGRGYYRIMPAPRKPSLNWPF
jgi:hypothetical protein